MANGINLTGLDEIRQNWGWLLTLGVALLLLGFCATSMAVTATFATVVALGAILLVSGVFEITNAFRHSEYSGFWIHLFAGILDIVCGAMLIAFPAAGAVVITLVLAIFFLVGGLGRIFSAIRLKLPGRGMAIVSGVVDVILGLILIARWPMLSLWFLGVCVGIGLILRGLWWVVFSLSIRKPQEVL